MFSENVIIFFSWENKVIAVDQSETKYKTARLTISNNMDVHV